MRLYENWRLSGQHEMRNCAATAAGLGGAVKIIDMPGGAVVDTYYVGFPTLRYCTDDTS